MVDLKIELPEEFFREEIKNDFLITEDMKKVWAVELDLLNELLSVCRKYKLKIFVDGGTLLGAVRHNGFIPWDNDIDLIMPRPDYNKLCRIAGKEFKEPYFFQSYRTEENYPRRHAQLRNSHTTGILKDELKHNFTFNQGIFIDIFILDGFHKDKNKFRKQKRKGEIFQRILGYKSGRKSKYMIVNGICGIIPWNFAVKQMDKILMEKKYQDSETVANLSLGFDIGKRVTLRDKNFYEETEYLPFETIEVPVPKDYHVWLTSRYGDYMKPSKAGAIHGDVIFDTDVPYNEYLQKNFKKQR